MAKYILPEFAPELRVVARGTASNRLVIVFDTATDLDLKRSPRIVMIDTEGVTSITTSVDEITTDDRVLHQLVSGKINLLTQKDGTEAVKYLLAEFQLQIEGGKASGKDGKLSYPPEAEIEQIIRQGLADAFTDASLEMMAGDPAPAVEYRGQEDFPARQPWTPRPAPVYAGAGPALSMRASAAAKPRLSKKMIAFIGLLAVLLLAAALKLMAAPADPVQAAVNKALANDPRARDEQIEITRQTLREMGLDPGKNGDLGCLAAP